MNVFSEVNDGNAFSNFTEGIETIIANISGTTSKEDIAELNKLITNFRIKIADFYSENRKLNIGVVGQVKAGKSSFLNTLLFHGEVILPKASTPKTATLTKMEYSENNIMQIEYYSVDEWEVLVDNSRIDLEYEIYISAREIIGMMNASGLDPYQYLEKGIEKIQFETYGELISHLNDYVGEDGKFTPIVKAVTLFLNKEEFKELSIVDTPGLNDPIASRTIRTKEFMEVCDVVFFLSQSTSFLDKSDWELLSSQLPQKGVKKLVLIASKYDSVMRDVLRVQEEDDTFDQDRNTTDSIPMACKIIKKKLKERAKSKVEEYAKDLERRECSPELIEIIKQCAEPILVSALAYDMSKKPIEHYNSEEKNIYNVLCQFSEDIQSDLGLLGNIDLVTNIFESIVAEKEEILKMKSRSFIPNATEELKQTLSKFREKSEKRLALLSGNDREHLLAQKQNTENQIGNIKLDLVTVFSELNVKLESEKAEGIKELRTASKDYLEIKERTGSDTKTNSYTTGHLFWKKTHYYTYEEHYSYLIASDAIDNLRKYSVDAVNQVEEVFTDALQLKELKRKLLNVIVNNFDMGSEKYDSSLFRIMVEETVSAIDFPIIKVDVSETMDGIAAKFTGELTSAGEKISLGTVLSTAISRINDEMCNKLAETVKAFKNSIKDISNSMQTSLLENVNKEFQELLEKCENKDAEIERYRTSIYALETEIRKLV